MCTFLNETILPLLPLSLLILFIWISYMVILCMILSIPDSLSSISKWIIENLLLNLEFWTLLVTVFIARITFLAYKVYKEQAEISETTNLMTLWTEHNTIMARINDISISQPRHKYLIYFELIMYLERICNMYDKLWSNNKVLQERFHALFDGTIIHTMEEHYYPTMLYLFIFRNREYNEPCMIDSIEKYYKKYYTEYYTELKNRQEELDKKYKEDKANLLLELQGYQNGTQDKNQNE